MTNILDVQSPKSFDLIFYTKLNIVLKFYCVCLSLTLSATKAVKLPEVINVIRVIEASKSYTNGHVMSYYTGDMNEHRYFSSDVFISDKSDFSDFSSPWCKRTV